MNSFCSYLSRASRGVCNELERLSPVHVHFTSSVLKIHMSFGYVAMEDGADILTIEERAERACTAAKRASEPVKRWEEGLELQTVERRLRCGECGTSARCEVPAQSWQQRENPKLRCPFCSQELAAGS